MNNNNSNLILAIILALLIIFGWQYFFEKPRLNKLANQHKTYSKKMDKIKQDSMQNVVEAFADRKSSISDVKAGRVKISTPKIEGSISLKGVRLDDITLMDYKADIENNSEGVHLFSPANTQDSYFAEIGFFSEFSGTKLPDQNTIWKADGEMLEIGNNINFKWVNEDNVEFLIVAKIDQNYMLSLEQRVVNHSSKPISMAPYGLINRLHQPVQSSNAILHEGPIAVVSETLEDLTYEKIKDKKVQKFAKSKVDWIGFADKYWLSAFIPDQRFEYDSKFSYGVRAGIDQHQIDFLGKQFVVEPGHSVEFNHMLFTGAKNVNLLDDYSRHFDIKLFDRAIDFGIFYIITKPIFHMMNFFYKYFGNFGLSILMVTVIVKGLMFGVANKSFRSMKKMKQLQPEIARIKDLYSEDKTRLNQEIMALYKKEGVNPVSGCLPLFLQIPVFFSIYKVLYVTIEMRHAPFYGWIKDLSAPDPTSIFNLFGVLPFDPPTFLMIGIWPILMACTMFLQQKMSPAPTDIVQASVIKFLPLMFLFMFSSFPAGLLIYWTWNNILSIGQQYAINKLDKSGNA